MKKYVLLLLAFSVILCSPARPQTIQVSGEISSDVTWQATTVQVTGDVHIAQNATVTILPGTRVEFQGHYQLRIDGAIAAVRGAPVVENNILKNNQASQNGGAVHCTLSNPLLANRGAVYFYLSIPDICITLIRNNCAHQGLQLYIRDQFCDPNSYNGDLQVGIAQILVESGSYTGIYENSIN